MIGADSNNTNQAGFLVTMRDGTKYLIPTKKFIEEEIAHTLNVWNNDPEVIEDGEQATPEMAREWAVSRYTENMDNPAEVDEIFAGTDWSEFADVVIKLPSEPLAPEQLWDETAKIQFMPYGVTL